MQKFPAPLSVDVNKISEVSLQFIPLFNAFMYIHKMHTYSHTIGLINRVFPNGPGDWGSIPGRVIPKTQKMVLDAALLNT